MNFLPALSGALLSSLWQATVLALLLLAALQVLRAARHRYAAALLTLSLQSLLPLLTFIDRAGASGAALGGEPSGWERWLVAAWAVGAGAMSLRLAGGLVAIRRRVKRAARVPPEWERHLERLAANWNVARVVFRTDSTIDVPMTVGFVRPVVLLPLSLFTALPADALELLAAHELAHVRRWDYLVNLVQRAMEALFFFHPAIWWVSARVREEREVCCDDLVAERCAEPLHYANALLALEQHRHELVSLALASHGGAFMKRIERLISGKPSGRNSWAAAAVGALAVSAALLVAAAPAWAAGKSLSIAWLPPALSPHRALIEEVAKERGVDPDLLALFVLVESSGDADALSPSGAKGLMQLMPKTAEKVALELRVPYSPERLADPRFNLELGAAYLASQLASFPPGPRQIELAAAAYNGGPKAARAFLEGKKPLSSETERYSNLVARLWSDRSTVSSANYDAWRAAAWGRRAAEAVAPVTAKPSLEFGAQKNPFDGQPYQHAGIDLPAAMGSPVVAPLDGVVTEVAQDELRGRVIVLRHGGGLETRFFHLGDVNVAVDQRVTRGEPIASIGVSGKTTGPHVHFEVRDLGVAVDPSSFLGNSK